MRTRIVIALAERPSNTNQLANELGADYKAIRYQLEVLSKNALVQTPSKDSYGAMYFLTPLMESYLGYVREIWKRYGKSKINNDEGREKRV